MSLYDASEEVSAPTAPSAGRQVLYPKADGFYRKNSAGVEVKLVDAGSATAASIVNTPAGNIAAIDVQAALNELDTEKLSTTGVASSMTLARIAGSTYSTLQHWRNNMASSGIIAGGVMSDAGGATINVTTGSCAIRATTSHVDTLYFADFPAALGLAIPTNTIRYVGIEYNAGSPIVALRATDNFDYMTNFPLGVVTNEAGSLHLHISDRHAVDDAASHVAERFERTAGFARDEVDGGLILGETGTRNITLSAGAMWQKLVRLVIPAFNSSTGGTFDIYYRDGAGSFTKVAAQTQWPNTQFDNNTGTLATLATNKYAVCWFYVEPDDGNMIMLYGRTEHGSIAAAEAEAPPATLPNRVLAGARIIGKLVFQKTAATASSISSVFTTSFSTTGASIHSNLANLDYASAGHTGFVADVTKGVANGVASLDANALIPVSQLPPAAIERLVVVANQTARYALTITSIQNGDTVKQNDTGEMWYVVDSANLGNAAGYAVYTAGSASAVALGGVTGLGTGVATFLATPTLANFNTALSDADVATGGGTATGTNTGDNAANSTSAALAGSASQTFSAAAGATTNQVVNYGQVFGTPRTIQKFTTGSGTYTKPTSCVAIKVRMVGGGGGGSGAITSGYGGIGGAGNNTTFGTSLLTAGGAVAAYTQYYGGVGGGGTVNAPATGFVITGGSGSGGFQTPLSNAYCVGGNGGNTPFGGGGGGTIVVAGLVGAANSGGGGGGGGITTTSVDTPSGGGGGGGGYVEALIVNPSATYSYAVGAAGAAGTGDVPGGAGGSGLIVVEEYYV